ncbi:uncharacterized protein LOC109789452 [Cajanus cajan]|nr:uncharacterized protein LOC109789452 [Cajanus cajan]
MPIKGNVCGYSNGLFLCCTGRYTSGQGYFVYDPLTKECTHIAPFPDTNKEAHMFAVGFISETTNSTRHFLVVIVNSFIRRLSHFRIKVFLSESSKWFIIYMSCLNGFAFAPQWMLSLAHKGNLYFMGATSILVINCISVGCHTIDYPEDANVMNIVSFGYLGCSGGTLKIAYISDDNHLRMWELISQAEDTTQNNFYQTWQLVHMTNLSMHLPTKFCVNYFKRVGGFHPYDGDIVYLHSFIDGIFVANLRTNKFEYIPGYDKFDISPFQLELPLPPPLSSTNN